MQPNALDECTTIESILRLPMYVQDKTRYKNKELGKKVFVNNIPLPSKKRTI